MGSTEVNAFLIPEFRQPLLRVRQLHRADLAAGWGHLLMPYALARKYPHANRESRMGMAVGVSPTEPLVRSKQRV